jgi:hypothetical protein
MKRLAAAVAMVLALSGAAFADAINVTVTEDGVPIGNASSADGTLNVDNQSFGTFNLNTLSINSATFLAPPGILNTNALDVQQTAQLLPHTFVIDITASGLTALAPSISALLSDFSVTGLTSGWSIQESTFINGNLLAATPAFFGNSAEATSTNAAVLTNPYSAEVRYTIQTTAGTAGEFNGGIDIDLAAVPGPTLGTGLPGLISACVALVALRRRRTRG